MAPQGEPRSPCSGYSMLPGARGFTRSLLPNPNQPFAARRSICPPVVPFTQEIAARHGMQERASVQPGNYVRGDFADGYGLVLLANTLRTEEVKICQTPLGKVFKALSPGRQFVIHGVVPNPDYVTPLQPATLQLQISLSFPGGRASGRSDSRPGDRGRGCRSGGDMSAIIGLQLAGDQSQTGLRARQTV